VTDGYCKAKMGGRSHFRLLVGRSTSGPRQVSPGPHTMKQVAPAEDPYSIFVPQYHLMRRSSDLFGMRMFRVFGTIILHVQRHCQLRISFRFRRNDYWKARRNETWTEINQRPFTHA